MAHQQHN